MKVIIFGASGMVGQGALRECLLDPEVEAVLSIGRSASGQRHAKLKELVQQDVDDFDDARARARRLRRLPVLRRGLRGRYERARLSAYYL